MWKGIKELSYLLGYDLGSSSIKASVVEIGSGKTVASAVSPSEEMEIHAPKPDWAEQNPEDWWKHIKLATAMIRNQTSINLKEVKAIGISAVSSDFKSEIKISRPLSNCF